MLVKNKDTYKHLARVYDDVMRDVDYEAWADYIDSIIQKHNADAVTVLELAAGTGAISLSLDELDCYEILATDKSPEMIDVAREKAQKQHASINFGVVDFLDIQLSGHYDVILILFDSVNYLKKKTEIQKLLHEVSNIMSDHSLLIFDFTTPNYSPKVERDLNERRRTKYWNYNRISSYNSQSRIHRNLFEITLLNKDGEISDSFSEDHLQKAWKLSEMEEIISRSDLTITAKYADFEYREADTLSDRITMVLQCHQTR